MLITYGTRLYGRVDFVPGLFYVGTTFAHISGIPITPTQSYVILEGTERDDGFQGERIPVSNRSTIATYVQWWGGIAFVCATLFGVVIVGGLGTLTPLRTFGAILAAFVACFGGIGGLVVAALPHPRSAWVQLVVHLVHAGPLFFFWWAYENVPGLWEKYPHALVGYLIAGVGFHGCLVAFGLLRRFARPPLDLAIEYGRAVGANPELVAARLGGKTGPIQSAVDWELVEEPGERPVARPRE